MKAAITLAFLGASCIGISAFAQLAPAPVAESTQNPSPEPDFMKSPLWLGASYFGAGRYSDLETIVSNYIKSDTREDDGTQSLWYLSFGLDHWLQQWDESNDQETARRLESWHNQFPESALQPIVAAMHARATALRARGSGFSSTVTPEGWRLYKERDERAWNILMDNKERSSANPMWYHEAIYIGVDLDIAETELRKLFDEGLRRHPDYYAIYSAYMRLYAPIWGGNWESANEFIVEQTAKSRKEERDILYARLYWYVDTFNDGTPRFFEDSLADWPRMRRGFEKLLAAHPKGARNHAAFAAFACRANDAATYALLRPRIDRGFFKEVAPRGLSIDVCDARFMKPT